MTNQTLLSDDEIIDLLGRTMHAVADAAPMTSVAQPRQSHQRWVGVAAATVLAIGGAAGFLALYSQHDEATRASSATTVDAVAPAQPPNFGAHLSGLAGSTVGSPVVVVDDGDVRVAGYNDEDTGRVCVAIAISGIAGSGCFQPADIATGQMVVSSDPATGRVLVAGIVPDTVAAITEGSVTIRPVSNLWYSIIGLEQHRFVVSSSDGTLSATVSVFVGQAGTADSIPLGSATPSTLSVLTGPVGTADSIPSDAPDNSTVPNE